MPAADIPVEEALELMKQYLTELHQSGHWLPDRIVQGTLGPIRFRVSLTETTEIKDILKND